MHRWPILLKVGLVGGRMHGERENGRNRKGIGWTAPAQPITKGDLSKRDPKPKESKNRLTKQGKQ